MADRNSAEIFGFIFYEIANNAGVSPDLVMKIWAKSWQYDFTHDQMGVDRELTALGLAKRGLRPDYPEDGETLPYAEPDGSFNEAKQ